MPKQKKYIRKYKNTKGKTKYEYAKKGPGYLGSLAAVAPIFGAKALLGDLPKGAIEHALELKLKNPKGSLLKQFKQGLKGRGSGRAIGAGLGILTAPIFLKGVQLASSNNKKERNRGLAYIGLATASYQLPKGGAEGYRVGRAAGESSLKSLKRGGLLGGTRAFYKLPGALLMGYSIASGRKKGKKGEKSGLGKKLLLPALSGALLGAASRGGEDVVHQMATGKEKSLVKALRKALPAAGGGIVGGLLGGLILSTAVEGASKALKKEASFVRDVGLLPLIHAGFAGGLRYGGPGKFFSKFRSGRKIQKVVADKQSTQFAIGIREGIAGRQNPGVRASLLANMAMPELMVPRILGVDLGKQLRLLPEHRRPEALLKFKDYVQKNPGLKTHPRTGEPTPLLHNLDEAVDKALGLKPLREKSKTIPGAEALHNLYEKALYGKRGGLSKGLPRAGVQDKPSNLRKSIAPQGLAAAGLGSLFTALPFPLISGPAGAHFAVGGLKGSLPYLPVVGPWLQAQGKAEMSKGVIRGLFPGLKETRLARLGTIGKRYGLTPAIDDIARISEAASAHFKRKAGPKAKTLAGILAKKAIVPKQKKVSDVLPKALLAGGGLGVLTGALKALKEEKRRA